MRPRLFQPLLSAARLLTEAVDGVSATEVAQPGEYSLKMLRPYTQRIMNLLPQGSIKGSRESKYHELGVRRGPSRSVSASSLALRGLEA
ncbi:hypothetical protein B0H16DRAFT_1556161 [Mycena metata]|uniref:Uncharacterized protein n=1 Tax=Mycena metata TaxID=1033252 RepID=A0AAD7N608_9AGAR|nr:hypothetical protein B0H16DRAFT_1556118 [Mycena metata]KAJ7747063.1 hypothetical protein B0H16DRAFT_1556161 [Mycena metata]